MSRIIRSYVLRTLTTGGLLAGASLIAPATASSQSISPHRAFLNQSTLVPVNGALWIGSPAYSSDATGAEAELALLGRVSGHQGELQRSRTPFNGSAVDGERALLSRRNWFSLESE